MVCELTEKPVSARALYMRAYRAGANTHGIHTGQSAAYHAEYRKRRAAQGRTVRKRVHDIEAPGLKPPLTADYRKCGKEDPPLEQYAFEVSKGTAYFWAKRGKQEPAASRLPQWDLSQKQWIEAACRTSASANGDGRATPKRGEVFA